MISQPPLYNWLQTGVVSLFGLSLATISATKNLVLFLVYLSYYKLAREVLEDKLLPRSRRCPCSPFRNFSGKRNGI